MRPKLSWLCTCFIISTRAAADYPMHDGHTFLVLFLLPVRRRISRASKQMKKKNKQSRSNPVKWRFSPTNRAENAIQRAGLSACETRIHTYIYDIATRSKKQRVASLNSCGLAVWVPQGAL